MFKTINLLFFALLATTLIGQNQAPVITNLSATVDSDHIVIISYDVSDNENEDVEIRLRISDDNGNTYTIDATNATGDVGYPIPPGLGKQIIWDHTDVVEMDGNFFIKLTADDRLGFDIQELVDQVDSNRLLNTLQYLDGPRHWITGNDHVLDIQDSLVTYFNELNLETAVYTFPKGNYEAKNIVGSMTGISDNDSIYIVDAHYDSVSNSPGIDDNASGVAGFMEAARILSQYEFHKTIRFIGFDLEETGLEGSINYVENDIPDNEQIKGVFNLEMIGYATDQPNSQEFPDGFELLFGDAYNEIAANDFRGDFINNIGHPPSVGIMNAFENYASIYVPELSVISLPAPASWLIITPDLGRSDHAPFWLDNKPALMISDGANFRNPNYHESTDVIETINFEFMSNVVKAVIATVAELSEPAHATTATTTIDLVAEIQEFNCVQSIAPNPVTDLLTIQMGDCDFEKLHLQLFASSGYIVIDKHFDHPRLLNLNVSEIPTGIYILQFNVGIESYSEKIIIE